MATDTEMLDFLEAMGEPSGLKWIARPSVTGRGWRLHQDPRGEHATARAALEDAMTKFKSADEIKAAKIRRLEQQLEKLKAA